MTFMRRKQENTKDILEAFINILQNQSSNAHEFWNKNKALRYAISSIIDYSELEKILFLVLKSTSLEFIEIFANTVHKASKVNSINISYLINKINKRSFVKNEIDDFDIKMQIIKTGKREVVKLPPTTQQIDLEENLRMIEYYSLINNNFDLSLWDSFAENIPFVKNEEFLNKDYQEYRDHQPQSLPVAIIDTDSNIYQPNYDYDSFFMPQTSSLTFFQNNDNYDGMDIDYTHLSHLQISTSDDGKTLSDTNEPSDESLPRFDLADKSSLFHLQ